MIKEFKQFAFKGNLVDMAVGIIIGGAFATVVSSLVEDVFMPLVGLMTGGVNFSEHFITLKGGETEGAAYLTVEAAVNDGAVVLTWGNFVTNLISFLILAFVVFLVIQKFIGALKKEQEAPAEALKPSEEVLVLQEIRDLLSKQS